jgi:hypothetical protein
MRSITYYGCNIILAVTVALGVAACGNDKNGGNPDASIPDGGGCGAGGLMCTSGAECCSGTCDAMMHVCTMPACGVAGATCSKSSDCCGLQCNGGKCAQAQCIADGQACTSANASACCSNTCGSGNTCTPLNTMCKTAGNPCPNGNGDCCGKLCVNGQCAAPSLVSYCTQTGDICSKGSDCCTSICTIATGATVGTCAALTNAACAVDGTTCSGCTGCCSSLCAPFGVSGGHICQPASGCHVKGDVCQKNSDCCGGDPSQIGTIPGAGLVVCTPDPNHPGIGTCSDPVASNCPNPPGGCGNSCVPEGDACHYLGNGGCSSNSTRNDCCACISGKQCCKLDPAGIPRCNAIATCVPAGGACADSADCCNMAPCVPDSMGHLHCGSMCVPEGGICTTTSDCCAGFPCVVPPGQLQGTCTQIMPPAPDGGTSCALTFQACSTTQPCCGTVTCRGPFASGAKPCTAGETDCTCYDPVM